MSQITENVKRILAELTEGVELVAAVKSRRPDEILEAVEAGVKILGENYLQEAEIAYETIGTRAQWHFIGHLQKNKVKKAVQLFDMVETVDSSQIAALIDMRCRQAGKVMPVLIEVNSGREPQKSGVLPEDTERLIRQVAEYENIRVQGLMTMGPVAGDPEDSRPYFVETRNAFERIKSLDIPGVEMKYLSMGMTNSYKIAIDEGANIIRLGSILFGERPPGK
ncbi:MAG TPA: YggS family pyridoxal phosphate-dependent enzyme [Dehalococcoidia bacterium]|nr:YggS family pyridoxal phosphate-dependent enzyme [Dehalococcoidia bacterium]